MPPEKALDPRKDLLRNPNYRWLLSGAMITNLGDQFTLIALPWLVLQMTHDTRVLGLVLALIAVPRAIFILVGGAVVDRHSPKQVLMITKFVNTSLLGLAGRPGVARTGSTLEMIYALSLGIGVSTAFSIPVGRVHPAAGRAAKHN
jgi:MFS family permease